MADLMHALAEEVFRAFEEDGDGRRAQEIIERFCDRIVQPSGLTSSQFTLLYMVSLAGGEGLGRLARLVLTSRRALTHGLRALEKAGLLRILPGRDRRRRVSRLTLKGRRKLARALPLWEKAWVDNGIGTPGKSFDDQVRDCMKGMKELMVLEKLSGSRGSLDHALN